ncbi:MAG: hypothetical protein GXO47_11085 [Chlorobi bacterium]|nr:hypothetical protein [Chlorobiota bacterium]
MYEDNHIEHIRFKVPELPEDFVPRTNLIEHLNRHITHTVTIVSAGAGFGKTTLISSWVKQLPIKTVWLSIDALLSDSNIFFIHLAAAFRQQYPDISQRVEELIRYNKDIPVHKLISLLKEEVASLKERIILVMDDYHLAATPEVNKLLFNTLKIRLQYIHLVIITRHELNLPASLRTINKINEISAGQLRFSEEETARFIRNNLKSVSKTNDIKYLNRKTKGWITGLRFAMLYFQFRDNNFIIKDIEKLTDFSEEFFFDNIMSLLDDIIVDFLLRISILSEFTPELTDYILSINQSNEIINYLYKKNVFIIAIDKASGLYKMNDFFREQLLEVMHKKYTPEAINNLYHKAIKWYELKNQLNKAISIAVSIYNFDLAVSIVKGHMLYFINEDRIYTLQNWLNKLPDDYIENSPELLICKLWTVESEGLIWSFQEYLDKFNNIRKVSPELKTQTQLFRGILNFWGDNPENSISYFNDVKKNLPINKYYRYIHISEIHWAIASNTKGEGAKAHTELNNILTTTTPGDKHWYRIMGALSFLHIINAELCDAKKASLKIEEQLKTHPTIWVETWNNYLLGLINYLQNNLESAVMYFEKALKSKYVLDLITTVDCYAGLLYALHSLNRRDEIPHVLTELEDFIMSSRNPLNMVWFNSIKARLALLDSDIKKAVKTAVDIDLRLENGNTLFWIELPRITKCNILTENNDTDELREIYETLTRYITFFRRTHNKLQLLKSLLTQTIVLLRLNEKEKALFLMDEILEIAKKGNVLQPFIINIKQIFPLFEDKVTDNNYADFIKQIIKKSSSQGNKDVTEFISRHQELKFIPCNENQILSKREIDIIMLMAKRMSNKEIAEELFISPGTVKLHTISIYKKLNVKKRTEAIAKALKLKVIKAV